MGKSYSKPSSSEFLNVFWCTLMYTKSYESDVCVICISKVNFCLPVFRKDDDRNDFFKIFFNFFYFMFAGKACSYMFSFGKVAWHSSLMLLPGRLLLIKSFLYGNFLPNYSLFCSCIRGRSF